MIRELLRLGKTLADEAAKQLRRQIRRGTLALDTLTVRAGLEALIAAKKLELRQLRERLAKLIVDQALRRRTLELSQEGRLAGWRDAESLQAEIERCQPQIDGLRQRARDLNAEIEAAAVEREELITSIRLAGLEQDLAQLEEDVLVPDPRLQELREQSAQVREQLRQAGLRDD